MEDRVCDCRGPTTVGSACAPEGERRDSFGRAQRGVAGEQLDPLRVRRLVSGKSAQPTGPAHRIVHPAPLGAPTRHVAPAGGFSSPQSKERQHQTEKKKKTTTASAATPANSNRPERNIRQGQTHTEAGASRRNSAVATVPHSLTNESLPGGVAAPLCSPLVVARPLLARPSCPCSSSTRLTWRVRTRAHCSPLHSATASSTYSPRPPRMETSPCISRRYARRTNGHRKCRETHEALDEGAVGSHGCAALCSLRALLCSFVRAGRAPGSRGGVASQWRVQSVALASSFEFACEWLG